MKSMHRIVMGIAKVGAGLGTLLVAGAAAADSTVTFAGYQCMGASTWGDHGGRREGASFYGSSTICPLDRINSASTTDISGILIRVGDNSSSGSIRCHATSCNGMGDTCSETAEQSTGDSFTGNTYLSLGSVTAYNNGYAYIECTFPASSTSVVYSYRSTD